MKKQWINIGVLTGVFIAAVIVFSYLTNRGNDNMTADLGTATLPTISFSCDGYDVNPLTGYKQEMDIATMRDSVTPVTANQLVMNIDAYNREILSAGYRIYSLDGQQMLYENVMEDVKAQMTLPIEAGTLTEERMLVVELEVESEEVYYYTRIKDPSECNLTSCMDYIYNFHENALSKAENSGISDAIEPSGEGDNTTFQHVTIHSDYDHVTWGDLEPKVSGEERWYVMETNASYTSVKLEYEVLCSGEENQTDRYRVKEFFRVRMAADHIYLLNYDRKMEQIFNGSQKVLSEKGLLLGIASYDVPYMVNDDGTIVSFVQANELWNYNQDKDELSLLFSFVDAENMDVRNMTDAHEIKILAVEEDGNTTFAVYGYMNRGAHEGEVGAAVYYYNSSKNSIEEKVFVPSTKSAAIAADELERLVYYSTQKNMFYMLVGGTLYEIDLEKDRREELASGLTEGQYAVSDDGSMVAYQTDGNEDEATEITVKNLEDGAEYNISCAENECIKPLDFIYSDFVVGTARKDDAGTTIAGEQVLPMYKIEIRSAENEIIKTYESDNSYVQSVEVEDGMLTLRRVSKNGTVYSGMNAEYITNNEDKEKSNISLESYSTELKETQMRLTFADGIQDQMPKVLKPKQVLFEQADVEEFDSSLQTEGYYVYAYGELQGIYETAGDAIAEADRQSGVAVDTSLRYIYERGNRDTQYSMEGKDETISAMLQQLQSGKRPAEVISEISGNKGMNLTGCTTEELLYLISRGCLIIGMTDSQNSVILTGYTDETVNYIEAGTGVTGTVTYEQMDQMLSGSGGILEGYLE
ncbi:hypothetical protein LI221_14905 [Faecalimonas umbilicata]|nr:hypothetical protein [Faecalimonas umbilicata]